MIARIPSSLKTRCDWCVIAFHCFSAILALEKYFLVRKLYQETGGAYVSTQNWHKTRFAGNLGEPVRPVIQTGQTGQDKLVIL